MTHIALHSTSQPIALHSALHSLIHSTLHTALHTTLQYTLYNTTIYLNLEDFDPYHLKRDINNELEKIRSGLK